MSDATTRTLVDLYIGAVRTTDEATADRARDVALAIIQASNLDCDSLDLMGEPVGDTVQTLLMTAFMRGGHKLMDGIIKS